MLQQLDFYKGKNPTKVGMILIEANNLAKLIVAPIIESEATSSYITFSKNISKNTSLNNIASR